MTRLLFVLHPATYHLGHAGFHVLAVLGAIVPLVVAICTAVVLDHQRPGDQTPSSGDPR
jgi:hypothetical protein